jgi:hypothetical protein
MEQNWPRCITDNCKGIIVDGDYCIEHSGKWRELVDEASIKGHSVDLRGAVLEQAKVEYIIRKLERLDTPVTLFGGTLRADCDLSNLVVKNSLIFDRTEFRAESVFSNLQVKGRFKLDHVLFSGTRELGDVKADAVDIDSCQFDQHVHLKTLSEQLSIKNTLFRGRCNLSVFFTQIGVIDTAFSEVALIQTRAIQRDQLFILPRQIEGVKQADLKGLPRASLGVLKGVDATNLTLSGLDLSRCRIDNVHNLDKMTLEDVQFMHAPNWEYSAGKVRWLRRNSRRQVLYDEALWRRFRHPDSNWPDDTQDQSVSREGQATSSKPPAHISALYRKIRKAREDGKDEPGANDFYYGEMEMRRHSHDTSWGLKRLITLYWLVSGYGLRATRSVMALTLALVLGSVGFATIGFNESTHDRLVLVWDQTRGAPAFESIAIPGEKPGIAAAVSYSIESATSLIRSPQALPLTLWGQAFELILRFLGPGLLALTFFAVRNRLKR